MIHEVKNIGELEGTIDKLEKLKEAQQELLTHGVKDKLDSLRPRKLIQSTFTAFSSNKSFQKKMVIVATTTIAVLLLRKMIKKSGAGGLKTMVASAAISIIAEIVRNKLSHKA